MIEYIVYGEESGEIKSFNTLKEAKKFINQLVKFDKRKGIKDVYFIDVIDWGAKVKDMKTKTKYLISLLALMIILCCLIIYSNKYKNDIAKLQKEIKELKHKNDCDCGWYEDFYYEHSEEVGAYE